VTDNLNRAYRKAKTALIADIGRQPCEEGARFEAVRAIVNYVEYLEGRRSEDAIPVLDLGSSEPSSKKNAFEAFMLEENRGREMPDK